MRMGAGIPGAVAVGGGDVMAQYIIPAAGLIIVAIIEAVAARERRNAKRDRAAEDAQRRNQEELMVQLIQGNWAAIALGEATAKAVQRIPDAHCNGDMSKALEYATETKHATKEFLAKQGIHAVLE